MRQTPLTAEMRKTTMCEPTFRRLTAEEAAARIRGGVDSLVLFHRHPDGDAVGSGFALKLILEAMGCRTACVCEDELPERLRFLVGDAQASILRDAIPADMSPMQIIAVDSASPSQLGTLFEAYAGRIDLMIDHHGKGEMYADGWIIPEAAATGQMIRALTGVLIRSGRLAHFPAGSERLMYAAISSDTGCFRYSNATPDVHRVAADLLEAGFDAADINHRLFAIKSEKLLLAERLGYDRMQLFAGGRIGIVDMPMEVKRANGLSDEHLETLVDIPRSLAGVEVAAAIRQSGDAPVFRVSMRASGDTDVSAICAAFGGGGHIKAAGCTLTTAADMEEAVRLIAEAIKRAM